MELQFFLAYWVHDLNPFILQFTETIGIRWYGMAYLAAFVVFYILLRSYYNKGLSEINPEQQESLVMAGIIGVLAGGRLGYMLLYDLDNFLGNPLLLFKFWDGGISGMAFHGGLLGVIFAMIWVSWHKRISFLHMGDVLASLTPPGLFFGRLANFINGELWGKVTDVPWAVIFPKSGSGIPPELAAELISPRHPSQLYEAFTEGVLLTEYFQWRFRKRKEFNTPTGQLGAEFLIGYACARIFSEFFREPDASLIFGMSRGIFYSIFMILAGIIILLWVRSGRINRQETQ